MKPLPQPSHPSVIDPGLPFATPNFQTPAPSNQQLLSQTHDTETPCPVVSKTSRPRLHLWPTSRAKSSYAIPLEPSSPLAYTNLNMAPLAPMHTRNSSEALSPPAEEEEQVSEAAKLKGVFWPGMDIFDAAPPEARRRRNQKKETSAVTRLKSYSADVEPNEMIWTSTGSLWKERPITGQVDFDSSPYKLEASPSDRPHKKKSSRVARRIPLTEKDGNSKLKSSLFKPAVTPAPPPILTASVQPAGKAANKGKRKIAVLDERDEKPIDDQPELRESTSGFHFNAQQHMQQPAPSNMHAPHQILDSNFAAFYQPALQQGFYSGYDARRPPVYPFAFYAPYGHLGYDLPGFFSYPPPGNVLLQRQVVEETLSAAALHEEEDEYEEEEDDVDGQPWDVKMIADVEALHSPPEI